MDGRSIEGNLRRVATPADALMAVNAKLEDGRSHVLDTVFQRVSSTRSGRFRAGFRASPISWRHAGDASCLPPVDALHEPVHRDADYVR